MSPLGVLPDERREVLQVGALSALVGIPRAFTFTVGSAVFVEALGPEMLPWAYGVGAPVVAALGVAYVRGERRFGLRGVGAMVSLALAALLAVAALCLQRQLAVGAVAFALVVLTEAEFTLTNVSFWNVANRVFTVRQASRLFGLVSAGQSLPAILGGLAIPWLLQHVPTHGLLAGSCVGHLGIAAWMLLGVRLPERGPRAAPSERPRLLHLLGDRYLRGVAVLLGLQVFVFFAVDNALYFALEERMGSGEAVAAFLGRFLVVLGIAGLAFRFGLSGRWRRWFGLRSALLSTPATLLVLAVIGTAAGVLQVEPWTVLGLVVVLKLWERIAVDAIHAPSYYSLFLPLPTSERAGAQSALESVFAQVATLGSSFVLLGLLHVGQFGLQGLLVAIGAATLAWVFVGARVSAAYREALRESLAARRVEPGALPIADATTLDLIARETSSAQPSRVLRGLEILEELDAPNLAPVALGLLGHSNPNVVRAAAAWLENRPHPRRAGALRARLSEPRPPMASAALLRCYAACARQAAVPLLRSFLDKSPEERAGAAIGLLRYGEGPGARIGRDALEALLVDADPTLRVLGAEAIAAVGDVSFAPLAAERLRDPDLGVARAAALAIGALEAVPAPIVAQLVAATERPGLRRAAEAGLLGLGRQAWEALDQGPEATTPSQVQLLGQLGLPSKRLLELAETPALRTPALAALEMRSTELPSAVRPEVEALLEQALDELLALRLAERDAADPEAAPWPVTRRALEDAVQDAVEQTSSLAALLFDRSAIHEARRHRGSGIPEVEALAVELVEAAVPESVATRLLPLIEARPDDRSLRRMLDSELAAPSWPAARASLAARSDHLGQLVRAEAGGNASTERLRRLARLGIFEHLEITQLALLAERSLDPARRAPGPRLPLPPLEGPLPAWADDDTVLLRPSGASFPNDDPEGIAPQDVRWLLEDDANAAWRVLEHLCQRARGTTAHHATPTPEPPARADLRYSELLELMAALEQVPALAAASSRALAAVARTAREEQHGAGDALVREGELDASLVLLVEGTVEVLREGRTLGRLEAPTVFGELAAIDPAPRSATIRAQGPTRALFVPREALYALVLEDRAVLDFLIELVLGRL